MELLNTDQLNEKIKVTDELCLTHQINLVQFKKPDGYTSPYCMECTRENIKQTELEGVEKALGHDLDSSTYDVLARESTVSNELREASFSTFKAETKEEHEAKEFAIKQAKQYLNGMTGNTLIMGKPVIYAIPWPKPSTRATRLRMSLRASSLSALPKSSRAFSQAGSIGRVILQSMMP